MDIINVICWGNGKVPCRSTTGSAGYDLFAPKDVEILPTDIVCVPLNISMEIPKGYFGYIKERSSMALSSIITLSGIIDNDFRGEICILLFNLGTEKKVFKMGDRVGQILILGCLQQELHIIDKNQSTATSRGTGGFGSTGV